MLYQRRSPTSIISWLLFIILVPYIAVVVYFLIGARKQLTKNNNSALSLKEGGDVSQVEINSTDRILRSNGISGVSQHNNFELITDGVGAFNKMMAEINNAEKSISMSTYVFKRDCVTKAILEALTQKASQGVKVRLLLDSLGSSHLYFWQGIFRPLRKAGGEVAFFMPLFRLPYQNYINLRNHRKIYLFDEKTLMTGGMNLAEEYMGPEESIHRWKDVLFKTEGSSTYQYSQVFESGWSYATGQPIRQVKEPESIKCGNSSMQVVPSGPDIKGDALFEGLINAISMAKERVWIVTPYYVPDEMMNRTLKMAKRRGLDVKLITPKFSNHILADLSRSSYMRELAENEVDLVLYKGGMLHAKAILLDDNTVMIGSANLDNRSLLINYEVVSFAYSKDIVKEVEVWMSLFIKDADHEMPEASTLRRVSENFMRILAPQM